MPSVTVVTSFAYFAEIKEHNGFSPKYAIGMQSSSSFRRLTLKTARKQTHANLIVFASNKAKI